MRSIIQRVKYSSVEIDGSIYAEIAEGLLVLVGIEDHDTEEDIQWLTGKIARLRIFNDEGGVMNRSVMETEGEVMVISQFTLHASTRKGNRPSYIRAAKPSIAIPIYESFKKALAEEIGRPVKSGIFGADMKISLLNDGPVTLFIDTKNKE